MSEPCCSRPSIAKMDYKWPVFDAPEKQVMKVNRVCLHCFAHWFGVEPDVKQYTRKEWDAMMEEAFND
jgi:hypothetical protein